MNVIIAPGRLRQEDCHCLSCLERFCLQKRIRDRKQKWFRMGKKRSDSVQGAERQLSEECFNVSLSPMVLVLSCGLSTDAGTWLLPLKAFLAM